MTYLIVLFLTCVCAFALRNPLRKYPWLFYALAIAADILFVLSMQMPELSTVEKALICPMRKCMVPTALFTVVMFIGALPTTSRAAAWLRPVRAQLSIAACILAVGHALLYMSMYVPRLVGGLVALSNVVFAVAFGVVLLVLLVVLGATSFESVKKRMETQRWKSLQRFAYFFFVLLYVHAITLLAPAAFSGSGSALASATTYAVVLVAYVAARLTKSRIEN